MMTIPRNILPALLGLSLCAGLHAAATQEAPFAGEIAAFAAADTANPPPEGAVVAVGSSTMRMWSPRIEQDLAPLTVVPRGFGGSQFTHLNHYFEALVGQYEPRAILLYEGDNDINSGKSPETVLKDFRTFLQKVDEMDSGTRVYVIGIKPSPARWKLWPRMQEANRRMRQICEGDPSLTFVDVAPALMNACDQPDLAFYLPDGIHLTQAGYDQWATAIRSVVVPAEKPFEDAAQPAASPAG